MHDSIQFEEGFLYFVYCKRFLTKSLPSDTWIYIYRGNLTLTYKLFLFTLILCIFNLINLQAMGKEESEDHQNVALFDQFSAVTVDFRFVVKYNLQGVPHKNVVLLSL